MATRKKPAAKRRNPRTLARFIRALGACSVPSLAFRTTPERAWDKANAEQRRWVRTEVFRKRGKKHIYNGSICWCQEDVTSQQKRAVFAAFLRFQKTGEVTK